MWKTKRIMKRLEASKGNGTSMVTLVIPPKENIANALAFLNQEHS
jgi:peptide chain release factor subunit 1